MQAEEGIKRILEAAGLLPLLLICTLLLMSMLICGCKANKGYTPTITGKEIYSGKEGVVMEFFEGAPPKEIFEKSVLPIGIRLYNNGAYNIDKGYLSVGIEKDYMGLKGDLKSINENVRLDGSHITFNLKGKSIENPEGGRDVITFTADTKELGGIDPQSQSHLSLLSITSCYGYQTKAAETICIDSDVYGFKLREKSCEVKTLNLKPQGAPLAVTKIESEMVPGRDNPSIIKPRFTITVKNIGDGEVVRKEKVEESCSAEPLGHESWNYVNVKAYLSSISEDSNNDENKLDCDLVKEGPTDDGVMFLKEKEDVIRCSYEKGFEETRGAFSSMLYIILDYGYTSTISKEITIKKLLTH